MADDRVSSVVRSVMMAIASETFAFEMPPIMRLIRKIKNTLETDHTR
jgi:hypothetical protein